MGVSPGGRSTIRRSAGRRGCVAGLMFEENRESVCLYANEYIVMYIQYVSYMN